MVGNSILQGVNVPVQDILADIAKTRGFSVEGVYCRRDKRMGDSVTASSVRTSAGKPKLDESAVVVRRS